MNGEVFWSLEIRDIKKGYIERDAYYECLLCGKKIEKGVIYKRNTKLFEAEKEMKFHITEIHVSVFDYIINLDKKITGISEQQKKLLKLFYQGKNDKEIKEEIGVGSVSTIRNHRFLLKERERQAKLFLSLAELLKEKDKNDIKFIEPHKSAKLIDDRYNITEEENKKSVEKYFIFENNEAVKLKRFPVKQKQKYIVIREIAKKIEKDKKYTEKEINKVIELFFDDYVTLRRYLIEYGFLDRKKDGSEYWLK